MKKEKVDLIGKFIHYLALASKLNNSGTQFFLDKFIEEIIKNVGDSENISQSIIDILKKSSKMFKQSMIFINFISRYWYDIKKADRATSITILLETRKMEMQTQSIKSMNINKEFYQGFGDI